MFCGNLLTGDATSISALVGALVVSLAKFLAIVLNVPYHIADQETHQ